jgi:hypothetical protein
VNTLHTDALLHTFGRTDLIDSAVAAIAAAPAISTKLTSRNWPPSAPNSPPPTRPSTATCSPSRTAPCPKPLCAPRIEALGAEAAALLAAAVDNPRLQLLILRS